MKKKNKKKATLVDFNNPVVHVRANEITHIYIDEVNALTQEQFDFVKDRTTRVNLGWRLPIYTGNIKND